MIGDYFTKALQGSQLRWFRKIIIGIHEDDIPVYNASRRALIGELKLKFKEYKWEDHEATKLAGA